MVNDKIHVGASQRALLQSLLHCLLAFSLCCVFLFQPVFAAPGDNIALQSNGSIATQSSYYSANWPASNCINGITASNNNAQLCHTGRNGTFYEWWDVQLPQAEPIDRVVIYNRTNCCSDRILGIYVLISDTPFPPERDAASLSTARAQADFEHYISVDVPVTTISVGNIPGQYVRLQKSGYNNSNSALNLLEIQVFEATEQVDLSIAKSVTDNSPDINDVVTFTLQIDNAGPSDAIDFAVSDTLPSGFGPAYNISHGGTVDASNSISWSIPLLAAGGTISLSFDSVVNAP